MIVPSPDPMPARSVSSDQLRGDRPVVWSDPLYGSVRLAGWAASLLATPPFARLAGISLSDVPGEWLFGGSFPSRLDHARGVYHLARLARPRDRALQAASLAHDLGHGPFSHISEPLMRARWRCDHEERAARQLAAVRSALSASARRRLEWLDWDEVSALVLGHGTDARGALLNGQLDFDNMDHVARFRLAAGLGQPGYNPVELARALRALPVDHAAAIQGGALGAPLALVYLLPQAKEAALAWQTARQEVYGFLHEHHRNLAPHAMLRRMIELAAIEDTLPPNFLDMTDDAALDCLAGNIHQGVAMLGQRVRAGAAAWHVCHWEAELPPEAAETLLRGSWQRRAELEAKLADEAGLAPQDVIVEVLISAAGRSLPPISSSGKPDGFLWLPVPHSTPPIAHLLVTAGTPRDYAHRLRTAAERHLGALGAIPRAFTARRRESSCDESRTSR